jgi:chromosome segregation ATPase
MSHDDLDHIPSIVPTRDNVPPRAASKARGSKGKGGGAQRPGAKSPNSNASGGSGLLTRLFITIALVAAAVACAWAWQLQEQLQQANIQTESYAARIGDLEARLSDTDEGVSQSAAVQAVKIGELEAEVRKLWDNVWKKSKERLGKLEASSTSQGKKIKSVEGSVAGVRSQLKSTSGDIAKLKSVAGDLSRLMSSAKANQAEVERVADTLASMKLDMARMNKQVQGNKEAVDAFNAFRRQMMGSITELEGAVRVLRATP